MLILENKNENFEKLLKEKMDELSSSVNCFDKISSRVFPETEADFSESGFTISDVENITGRSRKIPFLRWIGAAAAAFLLIVFIPKNLMYEKVLYKLGSGTSDSSYLGIIRDIDTRTGEYQEFDIPLEDYLRNDRLITALYGCPFGSTNQKDVRVKIYIKKINGFLTNETYAVEYSGDFTEENYIAAAESETIFTEEEVSQIYGMDIDFPSCEYDNMTAVGDNYFADDVFIRDSQGNAVSVASCRTNFIIKSEDEIMPVTVGMIYGRKNNDRYFYDTKISGTDNSVYDISFNWKKSLSPTGRNTLPDENPLSFEKISIYGNKITGCSIYGFFKPYADSDTFSDRINTEYGIYKDNYFTSFGEISSVELPVFPETCKSISVYVSPFANCIYHIRTMDDNIIMQYETFSDDIICSSDFYKNPESITDFMKRCLQIIKDEDISHILEDDKERQKFTDRLKEKYKQRLEYETEQGKSA